MQYLTSVSSLLAAALLNAALPAAAQSPQAPGAAPAAGEGSQATPIDNTLPAVRASAAREQGRDRLITQDRPTQASKSPVSLQDTPFSATVIDVAQVRETGAKNIQDALLYTAGVYAGRYGFDTRGDWAAIRGLSPSSYLDGLRGIYGFYNNVRPELYSLSAVEVLKGPSSVLYGQAELGGIVNAVSKRPQAQPLHELELQLGSNQRRQLGLDTTGPLTAGGQWLYRVVALAREANTQVDHVHDDAQLLAPSLTWQPRPGTRLTLLAVHQVNDSVVSSQFLPAKGTLNPAPLGQIPSQRFAGEPGWDRYDTQKRELTLNLSHALSPSWRLEATARKTLSDSVTREIWAQVGAIPSDAGNIARTVYAADRKTSVAALDARLEGRLQLGATRHTLAIGLDHQNARWEEFNYFNQSGVGSFNLYNPVYGSSALGGLNLNTLALTDRPDNAIVQTGVYAMDHVTWGPWVASLAWRQDEARNKTLPVSGAATVVRNRANTGRVGLMYRLGNGWSPYASWSNAFVPNLGTDGTSTGSYLKPTTGRQHEAGLKYLANDGQTLINLAWFDIRQNNRVVDGSTPGGREQVGATTRGWELELRQRLGGLELMGNVAQLDAVNAANGTRLSAIAESTASAWAQYRLSHGWRVGLGGRHIGNVTGASGAPVVPSVSLFDAMVGYATGAWDLRFDVKNLADKTYVSWCRGVNQDCGYGDRLNAAFTARYRF